jgi:hypothetical protein
VEQFFQKSKAEMFGDYETSRLIMEEENPAEMKQLGHRPRDYDHKIWLDHAYGIMYEGVHAKVSLPFQAYYLLQFHMALAGIFKVGAKIYKSFSKRPILYFLVHQIKNKFKTNCPVPSNHEHVS